MAGSFEVDTDYSHLQRKAPLGIFFTNTLWFAHRAACPTRGFFELEHTAKSNDRLDAGRLVDSVWSFQDTPRFVSYFRSFQTGTLLVIGGSQRLVGGMQREKTYCGKEDYDPWPVFCPAGWINQCWTGTTLLPLFQNATHDICMPALEDSGLVCSSTMTAMVRRQFDKKWFSLDHGVYMCLVQP